MHLPRIAGARTSKLESNSRTAWESRIGKAGQWDLSARPRPVEGGSTLSPPEHSKHCLPAQYTGVAMSSLYVVKTAMTLTPQDPTLSGAFHRQPYPDPNLGPTRKALLGNPNPSGPPEGFKVERVPGHLESVLPTLLRGCGFDGTTGYRSEAAFLGPTWNLAANKTHPVKRYPAAGNRPPNYGPVEKLY